MSEKIRQLGFEGDDWHIETEKPEQYYVYCPTCEWDIPRTLTRETALLVAQGHINITGHQVLLQGENHFDTEII